MVDLYIDLVKTFLLNKFYFFTEEMVVFFFLEMCIIKFFFYRKIKRFIVVKNGLVEGGCGVNDVFFFN